MGKKRKRTGEGESRKISFEEGANLKEIYFFLLLDILPKRTSFLFMRGGRNKLTFPWRQLDIFFFITNMLFYLQHLVISSLKETYSATCQHFVPEDIFLHAEKSRWVCVQRDSTKSTGKPIFNPSPPFLLSPLLSSSGFRLKDHPGIKKSVCGGGTAA